MNHPDAPIDAFRSDDDLPGGDGEDHDCQPSHYDDSAYKRAAAIFCALGDPHCLKFLIVLEAKLCCVFEFAEAMSELLPAVPQSLRVLKSERIVCSRREGKHILYDMAGRHASRSETDGVIQAMEVTG